MFEKNKIDELVYAGETCSPENFLKITNEYEKKLREYHTQREKQKDQNQNKEYERIKDGFSKFY